MMDKRRALLWIAFLAVVAVAAILPEWLPVGGETVEVVEAEKDPSPPGVRPVSLATGSAAPAPAPSPPQGIGMEGVAGTDLFAAKSWAAPPPPAAAPPAPPPPSPPSAPPLPFTFMGRLDDGAAQRVFLQRGERAYVVAVGDVIDRTYRIESIRPGQITLIYLPLNIAQTLSPGSSP